MMSGKLITVLVALGIWVGYPGIALGSDPRDWAFEVFLDERSIGEQSFALRRRGALLEATIHARFDVDFLFFNAYDYAHQNTELWQDGCLQSLDADTDDNGTRHRLQGERRGDHFYLEIDTEATRLPACVMSFAYWNPAILQQSHLLNTQDGRYMPVTTTLVGEEQVQILDQQVAATRYRLDAAELHIDLWYAQDDARWLKLESLVDGNRLVFQPRIGAGQMAQLP